MQLPPKELRSLNSIAARANELDSVEPVISYWARFWIVQKAVSLQTVKRSPEVETYLIDVLENLEGAKKLHPGVVEIEDMQAGRRKVESFALQVFNNADREEKAKRATKQTAEKFLAAVAFLEICQVFGTPVKDITDKRKYAKVQAIRIQTALAAGKDPNASKGVPLQTVDSAEDAATPAEQAELDSLLFKDSNILVGRTASSNSESPPRSDHGTDSIEAKSHVHEPSQFRMQSESQNPSFSVEPTSGSEEPDNRPSLHVSGETRPETASSYLGPEPVITKSEADSVTSTTERFSPLRESPTLEPDGDAIQLAQKHAKWAISALNYEDVDTGIAELKKALSALGA